MKDFLIDVFVTLALLYIAALFLWIGAGGMD